MEAKTPNPEPLEKRTLLTFHIRENESENEKAASVTLCYIDITDLDEGSIFCVKESKDPNIPKGDYVIKKSNPFYTYFSDSKNEIIYRCYDLIKKT